MILYSELTSNFQILDYSCTHNQLLLRSDKNKVEVTTLTFFLNL